MDPLFAKHYNVLLGRFISLLNSYGSADRGKALEPLDAFFAYRLFLGRNPDAQEELPNLLSRKETLREFLCTIQESPEFARTGGFFPPQKLLMAEVEGFRFWFNTSDREMGVAMALGSYEPATVNLVRRLVRPGMRCIDLGAQTGFFTCLISQCIGETGRIHAFEPMPANYEMLTRNVRENRIEARVVGYPLAGSNKPATIEVSMLSNMMVLGDVEGTQKVSIQSVRIDDVVQEPIDFIKMDIEGHEPSALAGMAGIINAHRPIIVTEANEYWLRTCSGSSGNAYLDSLISLGYDVYREENLRVPLAAGSLQLDVLDSINLVAVPQGQGVPLAA